MKNVDIKQIVLDALTMYEDPDVGSITEPDFEAFADEVERRVSKNEYLSDVTHMLEFGQYIVENFSTLDGKTVKDYFKDYESNCG